jgi:hypothetical protein
MINPDNLLIASTLPTYVNPKTSTGSISISGTVANGNTANFTGSITSSIVANLFRADVYGYNTVTTTKLLLNTLLVMGTNLGGYSYTSTELCQIEISNSGQTVTVTYSIFNGTGSSITLTAQTINLTLAEYQVPF